MKISVLIPKGKIKHFNFVENRLNMSSNAKFMMPNENLPKYYSSAKKIIYNTYFQFNLTFLKFLGHKHLIIY